MIVYPDKVLEWIGERTGRGFGLRHVVYVVVVAITLMFIVMTLLMPVYPKLQWWYPLLSVGVLGVCRFIMSIVTSMFGFDD